MSNQQSNAPAASQGKNPPSSAPDGGFASKADATLTRPAAGATKSAGKLVKCTMRTNSLADDNTRELDIGVGKDGVLSRVEAIRVEQRVMRKISVGGDHSLADAPDDDPVKRSFLIAFRVYLAMHASENADDGRGALEDGVQLSFGPSVLSGADIKAAALMTGFHRYLRCRADEVRDAIRFILNRASAEQAEEIHPLACETAHNLRVNAAARYIPDYPQYAFVGAEYCSGITPRVLETLNASKAALLAAQKGSDLRSTHKFREAGKADGPGNGLPDF